MSDAGWTVVVVTLLAIILAAFAAMLCSGVDTATPGEVSACYQRCVALGAGCESKTDFAHRWEWNPRKAPSCACTCPQAMDGGR